MQMHGVEYFDEGAVADAGRGLRRARSPRNTLTPMLLRDSGWHSTHVHRDLKIPPWHNFRHAHCQGQTSRPGLRDGDEGGAWVTQAPCTVSETSDPRP